MHTSQLSDSRGAASGASPRRATDAVAADADSRRLRTSVWVVLVLLAAIKVWGMGSYVNPDGVSYLDVADAYRRGAWSHAINAYWSPMYSWLLALWLGLVKPSPQLEVRAVHFLGLLIFVVSLAAFEFFLRELLAARGRRSADGAPFLPAVPDLPLRLLGYGLVFWSWNSWFSSVVTPDLLMTVFVYLAAGLLLRIRDRAVPWTTFALLGGCLGLAYLAKTAMFPLSFAWLAIAGLADRGRRGRALRLAAGFAAFLLVAGPWVAVLTRSKNRLTFGEAGTISYQVYVSRQDDLHGAKPVHPTRRLLERPQLLAVSGEVPGTYPFHYDPSYWNEGVKTRLVFGGQVRAILRGLNDVWHIVATDESFLLMGSLVLGLLLFRRGTDWRRDLAPQWVVVLPGALGIAMYCLVHVEPRLIGVFTVMIWLGLYASFRRPIGNEAGAGEASLGRSVVLAVLLAMVVSIVPEQIFALRSAARAAARPASAFPNRDWDIARSLAALRILPGGRIAVIGHGGESYWARLARLQIVAEAVSDHEDSRFESVPGSANLLEPDGSLTGKAVAAFEATGGQAIVARHVPPSVAVHGWVRLDESDLYAYRLPGTSPAGKS
jgi:hypothetical protein